MSLTLNKPTKVDILLNKETNQVCYISYSFNYQFFVLIVLFSLCVCVCVCVLSLGLFLIYIPFFYQSLLHVCI